MGVSGLWSILCPSATEISLASLSGKTVAVDISGWIVDSQTCGISSAVLKPYLRNLFFRVSYLLNLGVVPVFVFDGEAPLLKANTLKHRNEKRFSKPSAGGGGRKRTLLAGMAKKCKEFLEAIGLDTIQASGEAEATCGWLSLSKIVSGVITEDSDCILYGALTVYKDFSVSIGSTNLTVYELERVKSMLGLGRNSLIALALLLGCDYTDGVQGVGAQSATKFVKSIPETEILNRMNSWRNTESEIFTKEKSPHCTKCGHPGTKRGHGTKGCQLCLSSKDCREMEPDYECSCDWHIESRASSDIYLEQQIKEKALKNPEFPFFDVQNEFLKSGAVSISGHQLGWREPNLNKLLDLMSRELGWESDYCFEKLLPVYTRWCVVNNGKGLLKPRKIVKSRCVRFVACFEVDWEKVSIFLDWDRQLLTTEPKELFRQAYPELVSIYEQSIVKKPRKKVISSKVKTPKIRKNIAKGRRISSYYGQHSDTVSEVKTSENCKVPKDSSPGNGLAQSFSNIALHESFESRSCVALQATPKANKHIPDVSDNKKEETNDSFLSDLSLLLDESSTQPEYLEDYVQCRSALAADETDESLIVDLIISNRSVKPTKNVLSSPSAVSTPKINVTRSTRPISYNRNELFCSSSQENEQGQVLGGKFGPTRTFMTPAKPRFSLSFEDIFTPDSKENCPQQSEELRGECDTSFEIDSPVPLRERLMNRK